MRYYQEGLAIHARRSDHPGVPVLLPLLQRLEIPSDPKRALGKGRDPGLVNRREGELITTELRGNMQYRVAHIQCLAINYCQSHV